MPDSLAPARPLAPAPTMSAPVNDLRAALESAFLRIGSVIRGQPEAIRLVGAAVLARGHVLLEDVPGVGKTTLARAVARAFGCSFSRVQFTADLLPSDVLGVQVIDTKSGELRFKKGPIFAHLVLADEINRASPKTQSALLEAMADRQVTVDDQTYPLEAPFSVLATQNPTEHHGAYPLPESQLDRFLVRLSLGYPPADDERALITQQGGGEALAALEPALEPASVRALQAEVEKVSIHDDVAGYLLALVEATRRHPDVGLGCSPRGSLAWAQLVRALAFLDGRAFVVPDDVKQVAHAVLVHRLQIRGAPEGGARHQAEAIVDEILAATAAPR